MKTYRFVIRAVPSSNNRYREHLQSGIGHVYVFAEDAVSAEQIAHAYMLKHDWIPTTVEHAFEIQPQQLLDLDKDEALLYQRAQRLGVAADIVTVPVAGSRLADPLSDHLS